MSAMPGRDVRHTPRVRLTYDDLIRMPDDGLRHEIIDGELYVSPAPGAPHQSISLALSAMLWHYLEANPIGRVFEAPFDVELRTHDIVEPDVLYFSNAVAEVALKPSHLKGVPELVVEIESASTRERDRTLKRRLYDDTGVREYWRIVPKSRTVEVHTRPQPGDAFMAPRGLPPPDVLTSPLLPGFEVSLARLFRGSDIQA